MIQKKMLIIHKIALGLLPSALCFWYYQRIVSNTVEKIYFTYTDGLLFLSDALALLAVLAWWMATLLDFFTAEKKSKETAIIQRSLGSLFTKESVKWWGLALCLLVSLSILWAGDWRISLNVSLHLWLIFGLFLSVSDQPKSWQAIAVGFCVALLLQIVIGFWEFGAQSTAFLTPLGMEWPGQLEPAMRGASIVEMPDGARWLRIYGSLPHPNVLGGFALLFLAGPTAFLLFSGKRQPWALALLAGGAALLILTFSRSAWVGLAAAGLVLTFHWRKFPRKQLLVTGLAVLTGLLSAAVPLYPLMFTRAGVGSAATEEFSNAGRVWLTGQALDIIQDHPLLGVGIGNFILEYAKRAPYGYLLEPVHNLPLLVISELGIAGVVIGIGLGVLIARSALRVTRPESILFSAFLIGLLVTSFFDHYLWTLPPGRMLLGLAFGLFAQIQKTGDDADSV